MLLFTSQSLWLAPYQPCVGWSNGMISLTLSLSLITQTEPKPHKTGQMMQAAFTTPVQPGYWLPALPAGTGPVPLTGPRISFTCSTSARKEWGSFMASSDSIFLLTRTFSF